MTTTFLTESTAAVAEPVRLRQPTYRSQQWRKRGPTMVGNYRLSSRLGTGGMADVFLALRATDGPLVAVKILRPGTGVLSCQREFELASAVDADRTAAPIEHGLAPAGAYLVTTYLPGYQCGTALVGEFGSAESLWTFGGALAGTLAAIHDRGIVHCDVKPSNLLVRDNDVRVIDFGISRHVGAPGAERDGKVECSRGWAAPEQLRALPPSPAADVFAWGCLLSLLATGSHPFASRYELEWMRRVESGQPDLDTLPMVFDKVIRAALAKEPGDRPSARNLVAMCRQGG